MSPIFISFRPTAAPSLARPRPAPIYRKMCRVSSLPTSQRIATTTASMQRFGFVSRRGGRRRRSPPSVKLVARLIARSMCWSWIFPARHRHRPVSLRARDRTVATGGTCLTSIAMATAPNGQDLASLPVDELALWTLQQMISSQRATFQRSHFLDQLLKGVGERMPGDSAYVQPETSQGNPPHLGRALADAWGWLADLLLRMLDRATLR